eukprot:g2083.t1
MAKGSRATTNENNIAIVFGATGATGKNVVSALQESNAYSNIILFGRRTLKEDDFSKFRKGKEKISKEVVVTDLKDYESVRKKITEEDIKASTVFNCLGTTRGQAGGAKGFYEVEHDMSSSVSKAAIDVKAKHISVVSAQGANHKVPQWSFFHPLWYTYTLGMKEQTVLSDNKETPYVSIFRPGMLNRLVEDRFMEKLILGTGLLNALRVDTLGKAMVKDAEIVLDENFKNEQSTEKPNVPLDAYVYEGNSFIQNFVKLPAFDASEEL